MEATERVWKLDRCMAQPMAHAVTSRTPKTLQVKRDDGRSSVTFRVRSADIGADWFTSEADAWKVLRARTMDAVRYAKDELQRKRTKLGMVESEMRRRGFDVDGGQSEPATD